MKYRCRRIKPEPVRGWVEVEAETPEQAVQEYHVGLCGSDAGKRWWVSMGKDTGYRMFFARIEVEGWGDIVSRVFHYGLWRRGGVRTGAKPTLRAVANAIDWEGDLEELVVEGWDLEETPEEAEVRRSW